MGKLEDFARLSEQQQKAGLTEEEGNLWDQLAEELGEEGITLKGFRKDGRAIIGFYGKEEAEENEDE